MVVKVVIECPEGKLVAPERVFPIITKLSLSNIAAGLGTANSFFSKNDTINAISEDVNMDSQSWGAYTRKMVINDKIIDASPNWVRLNCKIGDWANLLLR